MSIELQTVTTFNRSLRVQLILWTVIILTLVVVGLTTLFARNASRILEQQTTVQLTQLTAQSARAVADFIKARERTVDLWASDSLLLSVARDPALRAVFVTGLSGYLGGFAAREPWISDVLIIAEGEQVFSLSGRKDVLADTTGQPTDIGPFASVLQLVLERDRSDPSLAIWRTATDRGTLLEGIFVVLLLDPLVVQEHLHAEDSPSHGGIMALQDQTGFTFAELVMDLSAVPTPTADVETLDTEDLLIQRHRVAQSPLYVIGVAARADFQAPVRNMIAITASLGVGAIILGLLGTLYFTTRVTAPIRKLTSVVRAKADQKYGEIPSRSRKWIPFSKRGYRQDEVGELAAVFELLDQTTEELTASNQLLEDRNKDLRETRRTLSTSLNRLEREMDAARRLQLSMIAGDSELVQLGSSVQAVGLMEPAREVGGDFYDRFRMDEHRIVFFIGDVSDKGTASALLMSRTVSLVRFAAHQLARLTDSVPQPSDVLTQVNEELCKNNSTRMFVTLFLGVLDTRTGELTYANAGHISPILSSHNSVKPISADLPDMPLGVKPKSTYRNSHLTLPSDSRVVLYTDGVTEAENSDRKFFGVDRLVEVIHAQLDSDMETLLTSVSTALDHFVGGAEQFDDVTLLIIGWKPMGGGD